MTDPAAGVTPNMIGAYGPWAASLAGEGPARLSFRRDDFQEVQRADRMLGEVYRKAGAADRYHCSFYPGGHRFDRPMQDEAFAWFDRWLRAH